MSNLGVLMYSLLILIIMFAELLGLAGGAGAAIGGAADGLLGFGVDQMRINKNYNHQKDMLKMQQEFQEKMVKNKYQNEVQSMLDAGLNPATITGTSAVPTSPSAPSVSSPTKSDFSPQNALLATQMQNVRKDIAVKDADINKRNQEAYFYHQSGREKEVIADNIQRWNDSYYGNQEEQRKYYSSLSDVNKAKFDILMSWFDKGGVDKYIRRQETQIGLDESLTFKAKEEGAVVRYRAYSERLNANAHMTSAQAQKQLAQNQATYNEIYRGLAKEMGNNQAKQAMYWGARVAGAKSESELSEIRAAVEKQKGADWIATTEMAATYIHLGKDGADMVSSILTVGEEGLDMMLNFVPGGKGAKLFKSAGKLFKK